MLYDLSLHMGYIYDVPASGARHILRLMPLSLPNRQRLIAGSVKITPGPDEQSHFTDFFQHPATSILVREPHERLDIRMQARVQVESQPVGADFSPLLAKLPEEINDCWSIDPSSPHPFLFSSPRRPDTRDIAEYSRQPASTRGNMPPNSSRSLRRMSRTPAKPSRRQTSTTQTATSTAIEIIDQPTGLRVLRGGASASAESSAGSLISGSGKRLRFGGD